MILKIPEAEQQLILAVLDHHPPPSWLQHGTDVQLELWEKVKTLFQMLRQELKAYFSQLKAYFSGQPNTLHLLSQKPKELLSAELRKFIREQPGDRKLIAQLRDFYLALYALLQEGWDDIIRVFEGAGAFFEFDSPGLVLFFILANDANAQVHVSFINHEFRPRHRYDLYRMKKIITQAIDEGCPIDRIETSKGKPLKPKKRQRHSGKNIIDVYANEALKDFFPFKEFARLELSCVKACKIAESLTNNKNLKHKINEYECQKNLLNALIQSSFRQMKGHAYCRGQKQENQKEGGTYKS